MLLCVFLLASQWPDVEKQNDIAFRCNHDVEVYCFDPAAIVSFDWHCFIQCVFRWATHLGIRPISMIGRHLLPTGYDLRQDFRDWLLHLENGERVIALS